MSQSWRLKTVEVDNTEKATVSTPIVGATVILSPKGPRIFTRFNKGDTQGILNTFGYPSKDYPSIQDALDIINKCSMYIASPYKGGTYGGVFVTKTGTVPFGANGVSSKEISDYDTVAYSNQIGIGDGSTTQFTYVIPHAEKYKATSIKISLNGTAQTTTATAGTGSETITATGVSGTLITDKTSENLGKLSLTFSSAPTSGTTIGITYNMNLSDTYFVLFDKDMQEDDLQVQVKGVNDDNGHLESFDIYVSRYNPINLEYEELINSPFHVGLSDTSKDSYGDNIYIENVFGDNQNLFTPHVVTSVLSTFVDDGTMVNLEGGSRGTTPTGSDIATIYDELIDTSKFQIKFCMDATNKAEVIAKYENLRNNYQKRCRFVYCTDDVSGETIKDSPTTYNFGITANRGMYQYCLNWGTHVDIYQGNNFKCSNMGLICGRLVDAMNNGYGLASAWIDENGVGGILGSSITKLSQEGTSEDILEELDNLNFNPVVNDYNYGPMITGWRTRQVRKTVFSNIPQSSLADAIIEAIEREVMPGRVGKLIDEASFSVVRTGINAILNTYSNFFEDYYVWCDAENNPPETRELEQLRITVGVVFKNIARQVILSFVTYRNGTNVEVELKE